MANLTELPRASGRGWPFQSERASAPSTHVGEWPKITIVTPSYNQGNYIEKTLRSVLLQGYPNLELIVVDGGSDDQSVQVIEKYAQWLTWWVSEPDRGQSHAINKGLERSTGTLLGWLNSDDYLLPGALFKLAEAYLEDPTVGAVYGHGRMDDETGQVVYTPELKQVDHDMLFGWCFNNDFMQPSCLFTRDAWSAVGPINEDLHFTLDVEYWIRISERFSFRMISDMLSVSLSHPDAKTISMRNRSHAELAMLCLRWKRYQDAERVLQHIADGGNSGQEPSAASRLRFQLRKLRARWA